MCSSGAYSLPITNTYSPYPPTHPTPPTMYSSTVVRMLPRHLPIRRRTCKFYVHPPTHQPTNPLTMHSRQYIYSCNSTAYAYVTHPLTPPTMYGSSSSSTHPPHAFTPSTRFRVFPLVSMELVVLRGFWAYSSSIVLTPQHRYFNHL